MLICVAKAERDGVKRGRKGHSSLVGWDSSTAPVTLEVFSKTEAWISPSCIAGWISAFALSCKHGTCCAGRSAGGGNGNLAPFDLLPNPPTPPPPLLLCCVLFGKDERRVMQPRRASFTFDVFVTFVSENLNESLKSEAL